MAPRSLRRGAPRPEPLAGIVAGALAFLAPAAASAQPRPYTGAGSPSPCLLVGGRADGTAPEPTRKEPLSWEGHRCVSSIDAFTTVSLLLGTIPALFIRPSPTPWRGLNGFDEAWRGLVASSASTKQRADAASTALDAVSAADVAVDSMLVAGLRGRGVAWQITWIDAQAVGLSVLLQTLISHGTSRERPYGRTCPASPTPTDADCAGDFRYQSFFSGHTSAAFTLAGLTCMHHAHLPLWGGGAPDAAACALASGAAVAVGVLRTVADKHYLSDVLVGAGVGALSGLGVPWLYYRAGALHPVASHEARRPSVSVRVVPGPTGAAVTGTF